MSRGSTARSVCRFRPDSGIATYLTRGADTRHCFFLHLLHGHIHKQGGGDRDGPRRARKGAKTRKRSDEDTKRELENTEERRTGAKGNDDDDGYKTTTKDNDNYDKGRRRRQDNNEDNSKWTRCEDFKGTRT